MSILEPNGRWTYRAHEVVREAGLYEAIPALFEKLLAQGATIMEVEYIINSEARLEGCIRRMNERSSETGSYRKGSS